MTEKIDALKNALTENGNYDPEKAKSQTAEASSWFDSRLKWSGRISWMRLILVIIVFEFAFIMFYEATDTKAMIGYAVMMIITMILVGTIGVQSWVAGAKISVLKDIKLLRLDCLGRSTEQIATSASESFPMIGSMRRGLSVREYIAWLLLLMVVAGASAFVTLMLSNCAWPSDMAHFDGTPVTIEAPRTYAPLRVHIYLRMDQGICKVSRITPDHKQSEWFTMGAGSWHGSQLSAGDSIQFDPQGNTGEYWVRFE